MKSTLLLVIYTFLWTKTTVECLLWDRLTSCKLYRYIHLVMKNQKFITSIVTDVNLSWSHSQISHIIMWMMHSNNAIKNMQYDLTSYWSQVRHFSAYYHEKKIWVTKSGCNDNSLLLLKYSNLNAVNDDIRYDHKSFLQNLAWLPYFSLSFLWKRYVCQIISKYKNWK